MPNERRRRVVLVVGAALILLLSGQRAVLAGIHVYQRAIGPIAARAGIACKFSPSCSHYAEIVIARDGLVVGGFRTLSRVARCNPWTPPGTVDNP